MDKDPYEGFLGDVFSLSDDEARVREQSSTCLFSDGSLQDMSLREPFSVSDRGPQFHIKNDQPAFSTRKYETTEQRTARERQESLQVQKATEINFPVTLRFLFHVETLKHLKIYLSGRLDGEAVINGYNIRYHLAEDQGQKAPEGTLTIRGHFNSCLALLESWDYNYFKPDHFWNDYYGGISKVCIKTRHLVHERVVGMLIGVRGLQVDTFSSHNDCDIQVLGITLPKSTERIACIVGRISDTVKVVRDMFLTILTKPNELNRHVIYYHPYNYVVDIAKRGGGISQTHAEDKQHSIASRGPQHQRPRGHQYHHRFMNKSDGGSRNKSQRSKMSVSKHELQPPKSALNGFHEPLQVTKQSGNHSVVRLSKKNGSKEQLHHQRLIHNWPVPPNNNINSVLFFPPGHPGHSLINDFTNSNLLLSRRVQNNLTHWNPYGLLCSWSGFVNAADAGNNHQNFRIPNFTSKQTNNSNSAIHNINLHFGHSAEIPRPILENYRNGWNRLNQPASSFFSSGQTNSDTKLKRIQYQNAPKNVSHATGETTSSVGKVVTFTSVNTEVLYTYTTSPADPSEKAQEITLSQIAWQSYQLALEHPGSDTPRRVVLSCVLSCRKHPPAEAGKILPSRSFESTVPNHRMWATRKLRVVPKPKNIAIDQLRVLISNLRGWFYDEDELERIDTVEKTVNRVLCSSPKSDGEFWSTITEALGTRTEAELGPEELWPNDLFDVCIPRYPSSHQLASMGYQRNLAKNASSSDSFPELSSENSRNVTSPRNLLDHDDLLVKNYYSERVRNGGSSKNSETLPTSDPFDKSITSESVNGGLRNQSRLRSVHKTVSRFRFKFRQKSSGGKHDSARITKQPQRSSRRPMNSSRQPTHVTASRKLSYLHALAQKAYGTSETKSKSLPTPSCSMENLVTFFPIIRPVEFEKALLSNRDYITVVELIVDHFTAGTIIGTGGESINHIRRTCDCIIFIQPQTGQGKDRRIIISGTCTAINEALSLIADDLPTRSEADMEAEGSATSRISSKSGCVRKFHVRLLTPPVAPTGERADNFNLSLENPPTSHVAVEQKREALSRTVHENNGWIEVTNGRKHDWRAAAQKGAVRGDGVLPIGIGRNCGHSNSDTSSSKVTGPVVCVGAQPSGRKRNPAGYGLVLKDNKDVINERCRTEGVTQPSCS